NYAKQQVEIADRINDVETKVFALLNLGTAEKDLGDTNKALEHHQSMLQIARKAKNDIWIAHALQGIGEDYHHMGNRDQAVIFLNDALNKFEQCGIQTHVVEIQDFLSNEGY
ncbi:MAG: tetratricopeptide repeat protein, partial [Chloroflexi bacterium]|nr:tetratricopeptide repeat protein [Chloroflexota bacterium]